MIILQKEVIAANQADLANYIPSAAGTAIEKTAEKLITVSNKDPVGGDESPEYDVYFKIPMMIATTHEEWDLDFITNIVKGLSGMAGSVATGNIEGAIINGITVATSSIKSISQSMLASAKDYYVPWNVPVH